MHNNSSIGHCPNHRGRLTDHIKNLLTHRYLVMIASFLTNGIIFGVINSFGVLYVHLLTFFKNGNKDSAFSTYSYYISIKLFVLSLIISMVCNSVGSCSSSAPFKKPAFVNYRKPMSNYYSAPARPLPLFSTNQNVDEINDITPKRWRIGDSRMIRIKPRRYATEKNGFPGWCDEEIGCFYERQIHDCDGEITKVIPRNIEELGTKYKLFTSKNINSSIDFDNDIEEQQLQFSPFNASKKTIFIIHGWYSSFDANAWMGQLKDHILREKPDEYNVIGVDWSSKAKSINYPQVAADTLSVGYYLASFIRFLNEFSGMPLSSVHLIGHSLGSHVSGYAGEKLRFYRNRIGRITGLDPAGPAFREIQPTGRLDPTDADYIDVIHTDGIQPLCLGRSLGLGQTEALGDTDFYPNGGDNQPACTGKNFTTRGGLFKACDHQFATKLMLIKSQELPADCQFVGYRCKSYEDWLKGKCINCDKGERCAVLSLFGETDRFVGDSFLKQVQSGNKNPGLKYYFNTLENHPYCAYNYAFILIIGNNTNEIDVSFTLEIEGSAKIYNYAETDITMKPNARHRFLLVLGEKIGKVSRITMKCTFTNLDASSPLQANIISKFEINKIAIFFLSNMNKRIRRKESSIVCLSQSDGIGNFIFSPCPLS